MRKYINITALCLLMGMCAAPLWAQLDGSFRGVAKDHSGKPIVGATVLAYDAQTGRKYQGKTNGKGEYFIGTVYTGTYKLTLLQNGAPVDEHNNVPLSPSQEQVVNFLPAQESGMTAEQRQKIEAAQKQNEKIKGLNASLAQAKELEGAGNYDQAIAVLQQAIQVDPNQDLLWGYLGDAQRGAKKYPDAIESYQKALAIKPNSGAYMAQMADAYARSGQTDKAVQQYAAAAQAEPQNAGAYYFNEGAVLTNTGKVDEAIAAFDKAIQLDPNRADAYYWKGVDMIGKATMKDNKMVAPPGTAEAFNKYLELQPNGKYADAAKQMLASIGASVETSYGKSKAPSKKKP
ncbi:MAG TPA: tetratricopeptide repeat protein [Candidatus Binatia bacterium]|nr:tetratricopeptide repeat protein [Candidatus Binatia bacterium]